jgi:hypothetical protein
MTQIDLNKTLQKNDKKWSPKRAARTRGAEGSQGAFMTRSREAELADAFFFFEQQQHWNGTSSASVAMCEAFFDRHAQHTHMNDLSHAWDS